jgi:hypothetical protein
MRRLALFTLLAGCGGGSGTPFPDAGPCSVEPYDLPWPSAADPRVCARPPTTEVVRTICGLVDEDCAPVGSPEAPDLECLTDPGGPLPPDPAFVTLTGYADVFSSGPDADGARIFVYREDDIGPAVTSLDQVTPIATFDLVLDETTLAEARACPMDVDDPADLRGKCVPPDPDADCGGACPRALDAVEFCHAASCEPLQRWEVRYTIPGVPTNTFLVLRTMGLTGGVPDVANETWGPLVQYNVHLGTADRACASTEDKNCIDVAAATYRLNVNLLSRGDYQSIPVSAGLSGGVTPGNGAVAGEVHDCTDYRVEFAQVGYAPLPVKSTYFNGNPTHTFPDLGRADEGTDRLSLFAGFDIAPGPIEVEAIGLVGGTPTSLGRYTGRVWPDTVSVIGINAGKPPR